MIYLTAALYMEASPFIKAYECVKDTHFTHMQVFRSEEAVIIISGTGEVPSAISLTEVLTAFPPTSDDLFANVGTCGCPDRTHAVGETFLIHKITSENEARDYYPDLLYLHSFPEEALTTVSTLRTENAAAPGMLYDMEAAALFQAALRFFSTDRMFFFKTVSDYGENGTSVGPTFVFELMTGALVGITEALRSFHGNGLRKITYTESEEAVIASFFDLLYASETMRHELRRLILYYELERGYAIGMIRDFIESEQIGTEMPNAPHSKKEGKVYVERFRDLCLR